MDEQAPIVFATQVWEFKFCQKSHVKKAFQTERGWTRLGPTGSDRLEIAYEDAQLEKEIFLVLCKMTAMKMRVHHVDACGMVLTKSASSAPVDYMVARRRGLQKIVFNVEMMDVEGDHKDVRVYTAGGREVYKAVLAGESLWKTLVVNVRCFVQQECANMVPLGAQLLYGGRVLGPLDWKKRLCDELAEPKMPRAVRKATGQGKAKAKAVQRNV